MLLSGLAVRAMRCAPYVLGVGLLCCLIALGTGRPAWLSHGLQLAFGTPTREDLAIMFALLCALVLGWADRWYMKQKRANARKWQEWKHQDPWEDGGRWGS